MRKRYAYNNKVASILKFAKSQPQYFNFLIAMKRMAKVVKIADIRRDFDEMIKEELDSRGIEYPTSTDFGYILQANARKLGSYRIPAEDLEGDVLLNVFSDPHEAERIVYNAYSPHRGSFVKFFTNKIKHLMLNVISTSNRLKRRGLDEVVPAQQNDFEQAADSFTSVADSISAKEFKSIHDTALELEYDDLLHGFEAYTKTLRTKLFDPRIFEMLEYMLDEQDKRGLKGKSAPLYQYEIADHFGVSPMTIARWSKKLQKALKDFAKSEGLQGLEYTIDYMENKRDKKEDIIEIDAEMEH